MASLTRDLTHENFIGCTLTPEQYSFLENDLELSQQDVVSISCPKTGSTRINYILFAVVNCDAEEESFYSAKHKDKAIFVERPYQASEHQFQKLAEIPSPRVFKTHLPLRYFKRNFMKGQSGPKAVVAMRNPKDTLVSFFHFVKSKQHIWAQMTWDEYFEKVVCEEKLLEYNMDFNLDFWRLKDHENIHILKFEDMIEDSFTEMKKITEFLGKMYCDEEIEKLVRMTSFDTMKSMYNSETDKNAIVNNFFRKGQVGDWKSLFTDEQSKFVDDLCKKKYTPEGLIFKYE